MLMIAAGLAGIVGLRPILMSRGPGGIINRGGMMGMGGMMGHGGMKPMMQAMMGNMLPLGIDPATLPMPRSAGAKSLQHFCTQCHELPAPGLHTAAEWPAVVERMVARERMMSAYNMMGIQAPSDEELATLLAYLQRYAQMPLNKATAKELDTPAGRAFSETCSQCHALPDPAQHTAADWPGVVLRMKHNMEARGKPVPAPSTLDAVEAYLQKYAKRSGKGGV
ncbi:MAG: hypothetical protein EPN74_07295 [Rhodanobacter sp.]|nr:MAG: hypothetical protein EPN74_07295 [Rhodanobacter sp.]